MKTCVKVPKVDAVDDLESDYGKKKAKEMDLDVSGAAMASEAFFPFRDSIDAAAEAGIKAIIEPGGSIRDDEVIEAANEHGISLYFTTVRHFLH